MLEEVNRKLNVDSFKNGGGKAVGYFCEKTKDFFADAKKYFWGEDLSEKCFVWLQGESDAYMTKQEYMAFLEVLFERVKKLGITKFFIIRVGYWADDRISQIMLAQEEFCQTTCNAYMLTRACSNMPFFEQDESSWFIRHPGERYQKCRDSFYGFDNWHINEKGFKVIAKQATKNLFRVLRENQSPNLEKENVKALYKTGEIINERT